MVSASCGVTTVTAGAVDHVRGALVGSSTAASRLRPSWSESDVPCPKPIGVLAGDWASGAYVTSCSPAPSSGRPLPAELLDVLQLAGERDKPEFAPDVTVDPNGKWQFAQHPEATLEELAGLQ